MKLWMGNCEDTSSQDAPKTILTFVGRYQNEYSTGTTLEDIWIFTDN